MRERSNGRFLPHAGRSNGRLPQADSLLRSSCIFHRQLRPQATASALRLHHTLSPPFYFAPIEDKSPPRPPSKKGKLKLKCSEKTKHVTAAPKKITVSHIADTDDDMGDLDDLDDDTDT
ncbi:hypothetical protein NDU88_001406 [Pleurodeles waltl]|uniref:Uncharacterized protein n=1 Tax=Pleurodeles waltl TaxID=8319 RepID=A0AAV7NAN3_PLEWA|nr:hypothetical protein NDU88_001406 [Pleurodeles waltl]